MRRLAFAFLFLTAATLAAQSPAKQPDWAKADEETMRHFQAIVRMDTTDPPGGEKPVADYLKQTLEAEGIEVQVRAMPNQPNRQNLVARIKGSGKLRPLLLMGHTDTVNVDAKKWSFPPFSATRDGGYIYFYHAVAVATNRVPGKDGRLWHDEV